MLVSIIYLLAMVINSVVLTTNGFNYKTWQWWASNLCVVIAYYAGNGRHL